MNIPILAIVLAIHSFSYAQPVVGFWEVKEVKVGVEVKTPVAKWTKVSKDGTYQSGNGWLQNSEGTWSYDKINNSYLPLETNGVTDKYGGFRVSFTKDQMIWEREEDGLPVVVKLERIAKLPKAPADILVGLWDLKEVLRNGQSEKAIYDRNDKHYIFIRWDRIYVERTPGNDRVTGYWHISGHRPEVTFLRHGADVSPESWTVLVDDRELRMTGISASNKDVVFVYTRSHQFPD